MNTSSNLDWFVLEKLYYEGCRLCLEGKREQGMDRFKRVYAETTDLWDVAEIIEGYYCLPSEDWSAKFGARFELRTMPNKPVERIAAGKHLWRIWKRLAAAIAHFYRSAFC